MIISVRTKGKYGLSKKCFITYSCFGSFLLFLPPKLKKTELAIDEEFILLSFGYITLRTLNILNYPYYDNNNYEQDRKGKGLIFPVFYP